MRRQPSKKINLRDGRRDEINRVESIAVSVNFERIGPGNGGEIDGRVHLRGPVLS